ncbi:MAG TPA: succinate dehydrogenase assembly factor 2 [Burkholderiales bacterium]|jgi:antitoxin CptB|nr:succinate dehydrogenase assembly factor 2 [Burkholderiales bacterium]
MDRLCLDRMKWKCRRGLLELDLVLARIVPTLKDEDVPAFSALLELPDNELWDIVAGRSDDYDPRLQRVVANLRAA